MSYQTQHTLSVYSKDRIIFSDEEPEYQKVMYGFYEMIPSVFSFPDSWNFRERHCSNVSKSNPEYFIMIDGQGDCEGDRWKDVYLNGEKIAHWELKPIDFPGIEEMITKHKI